MTLVWKSPIQLTSFLAQMSTTFLNHSNSRPPPTPPKSPATFLTWDFPSCFKLFTLQEVGTSSLITNRLLFTHLKCLKDLDEVLTCSISKDLVSGEKTFSKPENQRVKEDVRWRFFKGFIRSSSRYCQTDAKPTHREIKKALWSSEEVLFLAVHKTCSHHWSACVEIFFFFFSLSPL